MKFFNVKSLRFKLWVYLMIFAAAILAVLWLLQIIFIGNYYQSMRSNEIQGAAVRIEAAYGSADFENAMQKIALQNGLSVLLTDESGTVLYSSDTFGNPQNPFMQQQGARQQLQLQLPVMSGQGRQTESIFSTALTQLKDSKDGRVMYQAEDARFSNQYLVYGKILNAASGGTKVCLLVTASLNPLDATVSVLKNQFIIISIILIILAFGISWLISRRLIKPISKITAGAAQLAKGDYGVEFEKCGYSEVNQLSDTLNFATGELMKTDRLRRDLISNVSHDLRTPLTLIRAFAERIRDFSGNDPVKRDEHLQVIVDETNRLSSLVSDILDLSKIQAGVTELKLSDFDLSASVKDIMKRFDILCEHDGYVFKLNVEDGVTVNADEAKIRQVIYNLVSNAVNYTGDDKSVNISLMDLGNRIRFEVSDTGKGISEYNLPFIWDRYYKAGESHKQSVIGTGLGLSIVKSILTAHSALYGASSEIGEGSVFWFELLK